MAYRDYTLQMDFSGKYCAVFVRERGLIVYTTSYFSCPNYAVSAAMREIDSWY